MMTTALHQLLDLSANRFPDKIAVEEPNADGVSYAELDRLSNRVRDRMSAIGVKFGDRVAICMPKSADAVASLFGILKTGAAYVPLDPSAPASRNAFICCNCAVTVLIVEERLATDLRAELSRLECAPVLIELSGVGAGVPLAKALDLLDLVDAASSTPNVNPDLSRLAYILYTSGSTGRPKGVMLTHGNAAAFVDWCSDVFQPSDRDRFSSHAPFHFDLSIFDIYVSIKHGATLVIVGEQLGKEPLRLAEWIAEKKLTVWYSAASILSLLAQFGKLDEHDHSSLRLVLFAGEVFPIRYLKLLRRLWPLPRFFNLYGPTETNVCTFYEVPDTIADSQIEPLPIGKVCSHCRALVVDENECEVAHGNEGELCIAGTSVLQGYWHLPENTAGGFLTGRQGRWYRTGDIVAELGDGNYKFLGRRDRMIKKRGYRIELGEIETALYLHPEIKEAAVTALSDDSGVSVKAFVSTRHGAKLTTIELKQFCSENLPLYMVPDLFCHLDSLPHTSTDKIDYQKLKQLNETG
jgi:amino acid adenylation domain-containing protein